MKYITVWLVVLISYVSQFNSVATAESTGFIAEFLKAIETRNCATSTEVNYRSEQLESPNEKVSIHFEGVFRRLGQKNDYLDGDRCTPLQTLQAPRTEMALQRTGNISKIPLPSITDNSYGNYIYPVSFSKDSRYLIANSQWTNGYAGWNNFVIFDTENNYRILASSPCIHDESGGQFKGFISANEAVFECYPGGYTFVEILDFSSEQIRRFKGEYAKELSYYGSVTSEAEIEKIQHFKAR